MQIESIHRYLIPNFWVVFTASWKVRVRLATSMLFLYSSTFLENVQKNGAVVPQGWDNAMYCRLSLDCVSYSRTTSDPSLPTSISLVGKKDAFEEWHFGCFLLQLSSHWSNVRKCESLSTAEIRGNPIWIGSVV